MIYIKDNKDITGTGFEHDGVVYTAGTLKHLTDEQLAEFGITKQEPPTPPEPSPIELLLAQAEAVRLALIDAVQAQFQAVQAEIGAFFQSSSEFKTFAAFPNAFQTPAQLFGAWEAEVWHQANLYKLQVLAGQAPMLTPEQAVAMMPDYPLE